MNSPRSLVTVAEDSLPGGVLGCRLGLVGRWAGEKGRGESRGLKTFSLSPLSPQKSHPLAGLNLQTAHRDTSDPSSSCKFSLHLIFIPSKSGLFIGSRIRMHCKMYVSVRICLPTAKTTILYVDQCLLK